MAYWERPVNYSSAISLQLKDNWKTLKCLANNPEYTFSYSIKGWNGIYNWKEMKKNDDNPQIGVLMYEIGKEIGAEYKPNITTAYPSFAINYLKGRNYNYGKGNLQDSLDRKRPVLISARRNNRCIFNLFNIIKIYETTGHT